jgi:hypothetical protein
VRPPGYFCYLRLKLISASFERAAFTVGRRNKFEGKQQHGNGQEQTNDRQNRETDHRKQQPQTYDKQTHNEVGGSFHETAFEIYHGSILLINE